MKHKAKYLTIIGGGLWGLSLGNLAKHNQENTINLWSRNSHETLELAIIRADVIVSAVSMKGVRPTIEKLQEINISETLIIVTATKGLDPETTHTPSQIWQGAFPHNPIVVLSGPNLSKEIQKGLPAATVVSSYNINAAETVQSIFSSDIFRVYLNNDPIGTELGGTLKNVIAIAAGVCDGLQLGINAKSALLTRALPEMIRVGTELGASPETFFGLSGLGDLMATCDSPLSRNYRVGYGLAQGQKLDQILIELGSTAEGVNTTNVLIDLAKKQKIAVPIARQVYRLLNGKITPQEAVQSLMARELKSEFDDLDF
ncbi:NAD(P)H-dependent glycerol-3-phosphate dehydrogenase [Aphanothece sacrum]|uniref:Glycerol-3-phosphate dehydrogenase [NAD(P)+] n=1 Tax=Aphanothece sacrum FPU1 TaxID=1920663 RepID=A0A401IJB8_APHSA|nr:NAD(P)H-dependent glycerol-3-phosphate dehydrogenase [Aphanothece sacrum]GBF81270.1 glycerol-3-phosphate dehydrogenase [Aphanothece sacrum FPU1]GBF83380.1 glycerol-3-phosphate dehydrogenase GpsA [Aphanothece sacrum FPU3]